MAFARRTLHRATQTLQAWLNNKGIFAALLAAMLLAAAPGFCQTDANEKLSINMRDADIGAVIQWIAEKTNKQIVIDPRVKGSMTVLANQQMTVDEAYQVFLAALDVYGFSATEAGGILRIVPAAIARVSPAAIVENYQDLGAGEQIVYVYRASNVSASRLQGLVEPLLPPGGYVKHFSENNSLVIADDADNVRRLLKLIEQIDNSGDLNIQVLRLQYASAEKVAALVGSMLQGEEDSGFAIASDQRSNAVLLTGDAGTRKRVQQLIKQLDQPISSGGATRVVYLNYLDAEEVQPILKNLSQTVSDDSKDDASSGSTINVEASKSANAIIMTAPPDMLDLMEKVIADIDIPRAQVLVEAIIVEVSKDFLKSLGVQWNSQLEGYDNVEVGTNFGLGPNPANITPGVTIASLLAEGLSLGYYRNGSLRALIRAIATETDANILSTPSILTLENQEAEILVGSNVPFKTGEATSSGSPTSNPFTTIERQDIGISLKITPKVNQNNSITLDILQEVEQLAPDIGNASDLVTDKRSIKTKVLVDDGTIIVLGGLISDKETVIENKVPFLGDIPLVGRLFKSTETLLEKQNLMVFIHPLIIDSSSDSDQVTRTRYQRSKTLQERYQSGDLRIEDATLRDFETYRPLEKTPDSSEQPPPTAEKP